jgi:hypothetical protein
MEQWSNGEYIPRFVVKCHTHAVELMSGIAVRLTGVPSPHSPVLRGVWCDHGAGRRQKVPTI